jgi:membrane peptidoglycan carboxypeptidase
MVRQFPSRQGRPHWLRAVSAAAWIGLVAGAMWFVSIELEASPVQSKVFTGLAGKLAYRVEPGPAPAARFPEAGPYNERLGYAQLPRYIAALQGQGYRIDHQARLSPQFVSFIDLGGFPVFLEKAQAGLSVLDRSGEVIYYARHPERVFARFEDIPPLLVSTLLFLENRELLDLDHPTRNPAVEWDRFAAAAANTVVREITGSEQRFGGSTLATQIEKYRHSPDGRTGSVGEKLRQITSASVRAYAAGPDTTASRKQIILDYVNSTPLSARPGFGEIIGLGDGLWAWYARDAADVARLLRTAPATPAETAARAAAYKQVLSLLLAQRRPSYFLLGGRNDLLQLTHAHLRLLADDGVIDAALRDAALAAPLAFRSAAPAPAETSFLDRKATNAARTHLAGLLDEPLYYDLDRLDLRVESTLDGAAQAAVVATLRNLMTRDGAAKAGLTGERMLGRGDPDGVVYSFTLFERGEGANLLRVQADNMDRPLDLNEGGKFDLGSTAKLRTLVTYLEIIAELHGRLQHEDRAGLQAKSKVGDPLTRWAAQYLSGTSDRSLKAMVSAAMQRKYSAGAGEAFFTGSGRHTFANFGRFGGVMTVSDAFRNSVNLVFIRMMRDIIKYYQAHSGRDAAALLDDPAHPERQVYLARFADAEGKVFLGRFYGKYGKLSPDAALAALAERVHPLPHRLATVFRSVRPDADPAAFAAFMKQRLPKANLDADDLADLYEAYGVDRFNLHDRGYIARVHPLELWLVAHLQRHPGAAWSEVTAASQDERQEVYQWLFKSKRKGAADTRIRILLEQEAFESLHQAWARLGYPFPRLVPSLATAIGSSADRPQALAELIGIIVNDGVRLPTVRLTGLHFAEGTPYETHLSYAGDSGERLLPQEVAAALQTALADVVANGTAKRVAGSYRDAQGAVLPIGGKTGTGDELAEHYGPGTAAGKKKEVSRSAAFAFFIGERFFGVITAHVPGPNAQHYRFTSALPTQVVKALAPALQPLIGRPDGAKPQQVAEVEGRLR